ncbi:CHAD domain-containing protein [Candidatus Aeolococcus gillhamiae]|uniref:CHAD domain-containing protein n=1 Tax=Candidatus Aeolococcus gillhamiae TaxID=3127015 RepID=UPI0030779C40
MTSADGSTSACWTALWPPSSPRWKEGEGRLPLSRLARRPWRRLHKYVEALDDEPADAELHRIRSLAKRARYAADACVPAVGNAAAESAALLAALQTVLGEHHDAVVTRDWLQRQAGVIASISFVAGEMAALELGHIGVAAKRWRVEWGSASRSGNWRWLRS